MPAPRRKSDQFKESQHNFVGVSPTDADIVGDTPTKEDIVRQPPTLSDKIELVRVNARIAKTHRDRLEAIAREDGRLLSDVVREAIREYLRRR